MATPKINGTLLPVRTKLSTRYDAAKGFTTTQEFESAGDNLSGLALTASRNGYDFSLDANARKSRLVMTTTGAAAGFGGDTATSTWQLFTNDYQKDIRESPAAIALGPVVIAKIDAAVQMIQLVRNEGVDEDPLLDGLAQTYADFTNPTTGLFKPFTDERLLLDLILHGVTSFETTFYSARASINLPFLFAGEVPGVSPDSLMADLIKDIPIDGPNDGTLFRWGWRRIGTGRTFSGNNRTEISLEWRLGSWPPILYSDITALPV